VLYLMFKIIYVGEHQMIIKHIIIGLTISNFCRFNTIKNKIKILQYRNIILSIEYGEY
jgi:hypothetical protein